MMTRKTYRFKLSVIVLIVAVVVGFALRPISFKNAEKAQREWNMASKVSSESAFDGAVKEGGTIYAYGTVTAKNPVKDKYQKEYSYLETSHYHIVVTYEPKYDRDGNYKGQQRKEKEVFDYSDIENSDVYLFYGHEIPFN